MQEFQATSTMVQLHLIYWQLEAILCLPSSEWQMLWRFCSCLDKSQVKIKVGETFRHKSKSPGRKNLECSP